MEGASRPERTAPLSRRASTLARARQYLREASGPSAPGPAVSNPQGPRRVSRRRSTNESQTSAPPVRDLAMEGPSNGNTRRDHARRAANVGMLSIDTSSLGSSSGSTSLHRRYESEILDSYSPARTNPSPSRPHPEAPGRFTRGPFARLLSRDSEVDNFSRHF